MDLDDVEDSLGKIRRRAARGDYESAHLEEDLLMIEVLRAIADGTGNASELAESTLRSQDIEFHRRRS